jgi:hypothetical protein
MIELMAVYQGCKLAHEGIRNAVEIYQQFKEDGKDVSEIIGEITGHLGKFFSSKEELITQEKEAKDKSKNSASPNSPKDIYDIVDDIFCEPDIPINPETGEPLFTKEDLTSFLEDICKPDIETQNPEVNIEPSNVNTAEVADAVNQCLGQAKGIFKDVRSNNELKLRYEKAEKDLEEILYHYRIIQNYYNELY